MCRTIKHQKGHKIESKNKAHYKINNFGVKIWGKVYYAVTLGSYQAERNPLLFELSSVLTCQSGIKYFTKNKQQKKFVLKKTSQKQNSFTVNTNKNGINHSRICVFDYKLGHLSRKFLW